MYGALFAFDLNLLHIISITFTALIFTELIMVALTIHTWHWAMLCAEVLNICYFIYYFNFTKLFFLTYFLNDNK